MREILFRGLTIDGVWRYGDLRKDLPNSTVYYDECSQRICWEHSNQPVKNGTVGQYTGLKDKNGVKIFEGDILTNECYNCVVEYESEICSFIRKRIGGYSKRLIMKETSMITNAYYSYGDEKENWRIIGNIHEVQNEDNA